VVGAALYDRCAKPVLLGKVVAVDEDVAVGDEDADHHDDAHIITQYPPQSTPQQSSPTTNKAESHRPDVRFRLRNISPFK